MGSVLFPEVEFNPVAEHVYEHASIVNEQGSRTSQSQTG